MANLRLLEDILVFVRLRVVSFFRLRPLADALIELVIVHRLDADLVLDDQFEECLRAECFYVGKSSVAMIRSIFISGSHPRKSEGGLETAFARDLRAREIPSSSNCGGAMPRRRALPGTCA